ncbi:MAG TPA: hypothetical protein VLE99_00035 [Candidatus Saccharimonadales bacterium]|nr:hypothetical protein [Candidatus Saccharimonadales bacterium]
MYPNGSQSDQTGASSLPPVPVPPSDISATNSALPSLPTAPLSLGGSAGTVKPSPASPLAVAGEARNLVSQYANDPFRLGGALNQLKLSYLAEQYHITTNTAEN